MSTPPPPPPPQQQQQPPLKGHCPCHSTTWTTTTTPLHIDACHCSLCLSSRGPFIAGSVPNDALRVAPSAPIKTLEATRLAVRGVCANCDALVWMKYHFEAGATVVNVGLMEGGLGRGVGRRIFVRGGEEWERWEARGGEVYWGFSGGFERALKGWESEGGKRRGDV